MANNSILIMFDETYNVTEIEIDVLKGQGDHIFIWPVDSSVRPECEDFSNSRFYNVDNSFRIIQSFDSEDGYQSTIKLSGDIFTKGLQIFSRDSKPVQISSLSVLGASYRAVVPGGPGPGVGPGTGWWPDSEEVCGNGDDDDNNCLIDCEDYVCRPYIRSVSAVNSACPSCYNGEIRFHATHREGYSFSIDGGTTWQSCPDNRDAYCVFTSLGLGEYHLMVTKGGCVIDLGKLSLTDGRLGSSTECKNGGFEDGDLNGWMSYSNMNVAFRPPGSQDGNVLQSYCLNHYDNEIQREITPQSGNYFARLGVDIQNRNFTARYQVGSAEQTLTFWHYMVFQVAHDPPTRNPRLEVTFRNAMNPDQIYRRTTIYEGTMDDDYLQESLTPEVLFRPWTCEEIATNAPIGAPLLVDFTVYGCTAEGHWGYVYLDGVCSENTQPMATIHPNLNICSDQLTQDGFFISASDVHNVQSYSWDVEIIRIGGVNSSFSLDRAFDNIIHPFDLSHELLARDLLASCETPTQIRIQLNMANNCSN